MEVKSRYEVIAQLEEQKRIYIMQRDDFEKALHRKNKELKQLQREVEDQEEEISQFKESMKQDKETLDELVKSVDESLERFAKLNGK